MALDTKNVADPCFKTILFIITIIILCNCIVSDCFVYPVCRLICSLARHCCAPAHCQHRRNVHRSDGLFRPSVPQGESHMGKGSANPERTSIVDTRGHRRPQQPVRFVQAISHPKHVPGFRERNRDAGRTHFRAQSETSARTTGLWSVPLSGRKPRGSLLFGLHNIDRYEYTL